MGSNLVRILKMKTDMMVKNMIGARNSKSGVTSGKICGVENIYSAMLVQSWRQKLLVVQGQAH